jgi:hypothetical protein
MPQHRIRDFIYGTWNVGEVSNARVMMRCGACQEQIEAGDNIVKLYPTIYKHDRGFPFPRIHHTRACLELYIAQFSTALDQLGR